MKVLSLVFLILCKFIESYGEPTRATFNIEIHSSRDSIHATCGYKDQGIDVEEGGSILINVKTTDDTGSVVDVYYPQIQRSNCTVDNKMTIGEPVNNDNNMQNWTLDVSNIQKNMFGMWRCDLYFDKDGGRAVSPNVEGYTRVQCAIHVRVKEKVKDVVQISFAISDHQEFPVCKTENITGTLRENQKFQVVATSDVIVFSKNTYSCYLRDGVNDVSPTKNLFHLQIDQSGKKIYSDEKVLSASMNNKLLVCKFGMDLLRFNDSVPVISYEHTDYPRADCSVQLFVEKESSEHSEGRGFGKNELDTNMIILICCVVGIIVILIIIGQTIALLYFKSRAQKRNRLDSLITQETFFDRHDQVTFRRYSHCKSRYSAPPSRRNNKCNRAVADTDSHIYEIVGVNALYKESVELDVSNRPPLPLPGETPEPPPVSLDTLPRPPKSKLLSSTLSLNSTGSSSQLVAGKHKKELPPPPVTTTGKAPCRPPKQLDEASPAVSLTRPPKPLPPPKNTSSLPKMPCTDPALLELKKALQKRNLGNVTQSVPSTVERKSPPEILAKPKPPAPATLPKKKVPIGGINPLSPPTMQFIAPKIEACLKSSSMKPSTTSENSTAFGKKPQTSGSGLESEPTSPLTKASPRIPATFGMKPKSSGSGLESDPTSPLTMSPKIPTTFGNKPKSSGSGLESEPTTLLTMLSPKIPATFGKKPMTSGFGLQPELSSISPVGITSSPTNSSNIQRPMRPSQDQEVPWYLTPIHSEEDLSQYSDDEWNYEQLQKFNIYNV